MVFFSGFTIILDFVNLYFIKFTRLPNAGLLQNRLGSLQFRALTQDVLSRLGSFWILSNPITTHRSFIVSGATHNERFYTLY